MSYRYTLLNAAAHMFNVSSRVNRSDKGGFPEPGGDIVRVSMEIQPFPNMRGGHDSLFTYISMAVTTFTLILPPVVHILSERMRFPPN